MYEEELTSTPATRVRRLRLDVVLVQTAVNVKCAPVLAPPAQEPTKKSLSLVDWLFAAAFDGLERAVGQMVRAVFR